MKLKRMFVVIVCLFLLSSTFIFASDNASTILFKGKLLLNNKELSLKQDMYNINGSVYIPIRSFAESLGAYIGYDKENQTIYVEQSQPADKKSEINKKTNNTIFTLQAFSSNTEYSYGEPIEIWARLSNHSKDEIKIFHGDSLIEYSITDEDGFTSKVLQGFSLNSSIFQSGDELNSSLKQSAFIFHNMSKQGLDHIDLATYLENTPRSTLLPRGNYEVRVSAQYTNEIGISDTLELTIPLNIK